MINRKIAALALGLALLAISAAASQAQTPPDPLPKGVITFVVPLAPAGPADVIARVIAGKLQERLGRTVIVDNKAGAGGNIGGAFVAKAAPDGLTWLYAPDFVLTTNQFLYASQGFDAANDLIPVARVEELAILLAVNAKKIAARDFNELVALSKTRELSFGSAGVGSPGHTSLEYLKSVSELRAAHVPYRGAALAMQDLIGGQIDAAFIVAGVLAPHIKSGDLRALATSGSKRLAALPDVPTASESGVKNFDAEFSNILSAPSATPVELRRFMAMQVSAILAMPDVRERLAALVEEPTARQDQDEALAWVARQRERWGRVIKSAGIKAE